MEILHDKFISRECIAKNRTQHKYYLSLIHLSQHIFDKNVDLLMYILTTLVTKKGKIGILMFNLGTISLFHPKIL